MSKREPTGRLARWCLKIQSYHFTVKHRKGYQNQNADAISRIDYSQLPDGNKTMSVNSASNITELPSKVLSTLPRDQTHSINQPQTTAVAPDITLWPTPVVKEQFDKSNILTDSNAVSLDDCSQMQPQFQEAVLY